MSNVTSFGLALAGICLCGYGIAEYVTSGGGSGGLPIWISTILGGFSYVFFEETKENSEKLANRTITVQEEEDVILMDALPSSAGGIN